MYGEQLEITVEFLDQSPSTFFRFLVNFKHKNYRDFPSVVTLVTLKYNKYLTQNASNDPYVLTSYVYFRNKVERVITELALNPY